MDLRLPPWSTALLLATVACDAAPEPEPRAPLAQTATGAADDGAPQNADALRDVPCGPTLCKQQQQSNFAIPRACCFDAEQGLCSAFGTNGRCQPPPVHDPQCPDAPVFNQILKGCCSEAGQCGVDSSAVGMGCQELSNPFLRQLSPDIPQPRACDRSKTPTRTPSADAGAADASTPPVTGASVDDVNGPEHADPVPNTPHEAPVVFEMKVPPILPGQERYLCQVFGNPFGKDVNLVTMESTSTHSHHHFLFMGKDFNQPGAAYPCQEVPPAMPFAFVAQGNHIVNNYPKGMGLRIKAGDGFMLQGHYVNTTEEVIEPVVRVRLYPGKPEAIETHVGIFFLMMGPGKDGVTPIPPGTPANKPVTFPGQGCKIAGYKAQDVNVSWLVGHMHASGVRIEATTNGKKIYESKQWDDPPTEVHDPAISMKSMTEVRWTCDYKNETNKTIVFGDKFNDAMCAIFGGYYPADPDSPTQLCQAPAGFDAVGVGGVRL